MKKLTIMLTSIVLVSCCDNKNSTTNALYGNVKMITEHTISIEQDLINQFITDTLAVTKIHFNERNQISDLNQITILTNEKMDIKYEYNLCNRLKKEHVKMSFDSIPMVINYIYENNLLVKTISESVIDSIYFKQLGTKKYNRDEDLIKSSVSHLFLDLKNGDTTEYSLYIYKYEKGQILAKSNFKFLKNPNKNVRSDYFHEDGEVKKINTFNANDSLTTLTRIDYKKDTLQNWITKKSYQNNILVAITAREIVYR